MNKILRHLKVLIILGCFFGVSKVHPMQNVLDYIQKFKVPAPQKTVDWLLFTPRIVYLACQETKEKGLQAFPSIVYLQGLFPGLLGYLYLRFRDNGLADAVKSRNVGLVKSLLAMGYYDRLSEERVLDLAATKGYDEIVALLLKSKANINNLNYRMYNSGRTPLMQAVDELHAETVNFLITNGADITITNYFGQNAEDFAQIHSTDSPEIQTKKRAIQKIFAEHKKKWSQQAQQAIETISEAPKEYRGAKDIAGIIEGYLYEVK